jgi:hypothetical protein
MFDLKLDTNGDLVFGGNLDLLGATGDQIYEQRVIVRLKIPRGLWVYDINGTLGSQLREIIRNARSYSADRARTYVMDALSPAGDISVREVEITPNESGTRVDITVSFRTTLMEEDIAFIPNEEELLLASLTL